MTGQAPPPQPSRAPRRPHPHRDPDPALRTLPEANRRGVLQAMAASLALAAAGCDARPDRSAIPHIVPPEEAVPGQPLFYATALPLGGIARPVVAEVHMGRPTRLDGNSLHPQGTGTALDPIGQAEILELYDPDRARAPRIEGVEVGRAALWSRLAALAAELEGTGGRGLRLLSGRSTSPTLLRQRDRLLARLPDAQWHVWEPTDQPARQDGIRLAFGDGVELRPRLDRAAAIICLGADPLGPGPHQIIHGAQWAARRQAIRTGALPPAPLLVAEATPGLTGMKADGRLAVREGRLPLLLAAIAQELGEGVPLAGDLTLAERAWAAHAADALGRHRGRSLLLTGGGLPAEVQALAHRLNHRLGNTGRTVDAVESPPALDGPGLDTLADAAAAGQVRTLVLLDSNPLYQAPADWAAALDRVPRLIQLSARRDESGQTADWHIPLAHPLESWSDARAADGTVSIIQPTIRPIFGGITLHQFLEGLAGGDPSDPLAPVRESWAGTLDEAAWQRSLRSGFVEGTAARPLAPTLRDTPPVTADAAPAEGLELVFRPHPTLWDGRYANNAWLQELPDPVTKAVWGNGIGMSPALARQLGVRTGQAVEITGPGGGPLVGAALPIPGQAEGVLTLWLGLGRTVAGRNGTGRGHNAGRLRPGAGGGWRLDGVQARGVGDRLELTLAQLEGRMQGRELARALPLDQPQVETPASAPFPPSLHPEWPYPDRRWAMAVDLDNCIGCSACVTACQAENSIPSVGPEEAARGRLLHWIRVERYWVDRPGPEGTVDTTARFLPVLCMHCEKAPCEVGCPVNATVHGPDGLNQMVYNRCIGTRTCAAYCPYEVRRFNYFSYADGDLAGAEPQRNPDVTVRARGVMEKCTYCVQRLRGAETAARVAGRDLGRDEVTTACAAACPSQALVFGDLNDPDSAVARLHGEGRAYHLLRELGTQPRTFYLAQLDLPGEEPA